MRSDFSLNNTTPHNTPERRTSANHINAMKYKIPAKRRNTTTRGSSVCVHAHTHTLLVPSAAMPEGAGAEATSSRTSARGGGGVAASSSADRRALATPADPLAAGEAIDELLAANGGPEHAKKRKYPDPGFAVERFGPTESRGSYTNRFKVKAAAFTKVLCTDGKPVGNHGAAKVLGVDKKRIVTWVKEEEKLKGMIAIKPKLSSAKSLHAGVAASTADIDQALENYINDQRKQRHGCGYKQEQAAGVEASCPRGSGRH